MDTIFDKKSEDKTLTEASFEELVLEASRKASTSAAAAILKTCPAAYHKLMSDLELESFIQECVIKHLETKLRAARKLK
jgi:hypothetical protein